MVMNHQSAFTDPIVVACFIHDRRANFLVRGDIFNTPLKRYLLTRLNQIPIYRSRDLQRSAAKEMADLNEITFQSTLDRFKEGKYVMIFSEGDCIQEKRLRAIKKGTARMVFRVLEESDVDLYIQPVGINYTDPLKIRNDVFVNYGEPIMARDFMEVYRENNARGIGHLTKLLQEKMEELVVSIPDKSLDSLSEDILALSRPRNPITPWLNRNPKYLKSEKRVESLLKEGVEDEQRLEEIKKIVASAKEICTEYGVKLSDVQNENVSWVFIITSFLLTPLSAAGYVFFSIADWIAHRITSKIKMKEFKPSIMIGTIGFLYPATLFLLFCVLWIINGATWAAMICAAVLLSRITYLYNSNMMISSLAKLRLLRLRNRNKEAFQKLLDSRKLLQKD